MWEGKNAVQQARTMLGATDPSESLPGTIRGDFGLETRRNVCHGSDSVASAQREIALWFQDGEDCLTCSTGSDSSDSRENCI